MSLIYLNQIWVRFVSISVPQYFWRSWVCKPYSCSYYYTEWKGLSWNHTRRRASKTFESSVGEHVHSNPDICSSLKLQTIFQIFCVGPLISPGVHKCDKQTHNVLTRDEYVVPSYLNQIYFYCCNILYKFWESYSYPQG